MRMLSDEILNLRDDLVSPFGGLKRSAWMEWLVGHVHHMQARARCLRQLNRTKEGDLVSLFQVCCYQNAFQKQASSGISAGTTASGDQMIHRDVSATSRQQKQQYRSPHQMLAPGIGIYEQLYDSNHGEQRQGCQPRGEPERQ